MNQSAPKMRLRLRAPAIAALLTWLLAAPMAGTAAADLAPLPAPRPVPQPGPRPVPVPGPKPAPSPTPVKPEPVRPEPVRPGVQPQKPLKPGPKIQDPKEREIARAKLLERVRTLRAGALAEVLKPDTAAVAKIVDIAAGFEDRTLAARQQARSLRHELEALLKQPKPDDAAINKLVDEVGAHRTRLQQVEDERAAAMRKVLSPSQYAKVMIAWPRINRRIQEQLFKALIRSKETSAAVDEY